jgi:hypothetical protein
MLPIPIMSTETLASCAETRQTGAAKTSAANKTRFIIAAGDVEIVVCVILGELFGHRPSRKSLRPRGVAIISAPIFLKPVAQNSLPANAFRQEQRPAYVSPEAGHRLLRVVLAMNRCLHRPSPLPAVAAFAA